MRENTVKITASEYGNRKLRRETATNREKEEGREKALD